MHDPLTDEQIFDVLCKLRGDSALERSQETLASLEELQRPMKTPQSLLDLGHAASDDSVDRRVTLPLRFSFDEAFGDDLDDTELCSMQLSNHNGNHMESIGLGDFKHNALVLKAVELINRLDLAGLQWLSLSLTTY